MKYFVVNSSSLTESKKLVPLYYFYKTILKEEFIKKGIKFVKIKNEADSISDGEHSAIPRNNKNGIRYLYGRNIKEGIIDFDPISDSSFIDKNDYENYKRCHIKENDVLIAIYGTVGKSAVYKSEYVGIAGIPRHISNISIKSESEITPEYLSAYFRSRCGKLQIFGALTGNIQQLFSLKSIKDYEVPLLNRSLISKVTEIEKEAIDCEIIAQKKINEAKILLYNSLVTDVKNFKSSLSFEVSSKKLMESNIFSVEYYDPLYSQVEQSLINEDRALPISKISELQHGDEVGSDAYCGFIDRNLEDVPFIRTTDIVNNEADLYPDFFVDPSNRKLINQKVNMSDVIFTKDGKIGAVGLITSEDNIILSSGIEIIRLNEFGLSLGYTQEYLFTALSIPEIGLYGALKRTVFAATIPHLREERLKEIVIPLVKRKEVNKITSLVKEAFIFKAKRKSLLKKSFLILEKELS